MTTDAISTIRPRHHLWVRGGSRVLGDRTWLMGVLNVTPDSFSDGGRFVDTAAAVARGLALFGAGADIVDVGGESTRPGAAATPAAEEIRRVTPVISALRARSDGLISIDTTKGEVARAALAAGADIVNDVSGLRFDPALSRVVAESDVPVVLMHLRGEFRTMHREPRYHDVMAEVVAELAGSMALANAAGIPADRVLLDPGIGFAKDAAHSLEALRRLAELHALGRPLLVGPSRKSFIGKVLDAGVDQRLFGTAAAVAACVLAGAHVVRVHDVKEMAQVTRVCDAILGEAA
jgi:dihydropteroate synthase